MVRVGWCKDDFLQFTINIFLDSATFAIQTLRMKCLPTFFLQKVSMLKNNLCNFHENIMQLKISVFYVHCVKLSQAAQAYAVPEK